MRRRLPRIFAVILAIMSLAGANPYRVIPDSVADDGAELAQAAMRQRILLSREDTRVASIGQGDGAMRDPSDEVVIQPLGIIDASKNENTPIPTEDVPPTPTPQRQLVALNAREISDQEIARWGDLDDKIIKKDDSETQARVEDDPKPRAAAHPVLGSVEKTWQVKEDGLSIRVDRRKIGSNRVFIATIRASVDRMATYTVAGPGETASSKTTSAMAKGVDATIAINGDCFDYYTRRDMGIVIRNGVLYNNTPYGRWCYVIYEDGSARVVPDTDLNGEKLLLDGAKDVFAFGPALVRGGRFVKPEKENTHPRTAMGRVNDNTWIFMVVDGRQSGYSNGITYKGMADLFLALGCDSAYNMDGGGSSTIWLKGYGVLNKPSEGRERRVPDLIYFR